MTTYGNLAENINSAQKQILFHHNPSNTDGWITLAKKDPLTRKFHQRHYKPEELANCLSEWTGEDIYYSQNTFFKPHRRIDNIRQLRSLYVDLDVYNVGMTPEWVLGKLEFEFFRQTIPEPNMIIFSGRGLVLIWNIEPVPHMVMPLWKAVENFLLSELKAFGADSKASDPARIFRLAGSTNSKSKTIVTAQYRHDYRYDIHDIQYDYLPELTPKQTAPKRGRKTKIARLFNTYTLHLVRARDISRLVELRNGEVNSYREYICFLYRYFTCCYTNDPDKALEDALSLNEEFTNPLSQKELISATKSAERAWEAKSNDKADKLAKSLGYPGAGYSLTNAKIIEWLDITEEEQAQLETIIGAKEKRRRNLKQKEEKRRAEGVRPMEEYNLQRKQSVEDRKEALKLLMKEEPSMSNVKLAEALGVSEGYIRKLKKTM